MCWASVHATPLIERCLPTRRSGLPGETDEDVLGIAETVEWLQREVRDGRWHLAVNVTIRWARWRGRGAWREEEGGRCALLLRGRGVQAGAWLGRGCGGGARACRLPPRLLGLG